MIKYNGIIVVEGNTDEALLRSFLDCEIVKTGGSAVTRETIDYLKESSINREIIVLTDPDYPGMQIRKKLDENIQGLKHAFVPKETAIKHGKVGVAESPKDVIIDALKHLISNTPIKQGNLTASDLLELRLVGCQDSEKRRKIIEEKFHVGHTNGKTLLKRLNSLCITKEQLEKTINE